MPKSDRQKIFYELCRPKIQPFTYKNREFHFCSDFNSERANRREDIKSGANLPLDEKVVFFSKLGVLGGATSKAAFGCVALMFRIVYLGLSARKGRASHYAFRPSAHLAIIR